MGHVDNEKIAIQKVTQKMVRMTALRKNVQVTFCVALAHTTLN